MLVLAIDTATSAVTAGVVDVDAGTRPAGTPAEALTVLGERVTFDARAHGELLTPHVLDAARAAGIALRDLDAVVCGVGPGPYTGLRAGIVTAAALAHSLDIPAHPVCSLDAVAAGHVAGADHAGEPFLVVTDARRREVYWAAYDAAGQRTDGPHVDKPAELAPSIERIEHAGPRPAGIVRTALPAVLSGERPGPLTPLYLRRPDAARPGARKRVTTP